MNLFVKGTVDPEQSYHVKLKLSRTDLGVLATTGKLKKTIEQSTELEVGQFIRIVTPTRRTIEVEVEGEKLIADKEAICGCGNCTS